MFDTLDATVPHLPADRPRYLMGVGKPDDIVGAVLRGIDMFDCVLPTRSGRNGQAFTWNGTLNLRNAAPCRGSAPLDAGCRCPACRQFSPRLSASRGESKEIIAVDAADLAQSGLLPGSDGGTARRHCTGAVRAFAARVMAAYAREESGDAQE